MRLEELQKLTREERIELAKAKVEWNLRQSKRACEKSLLEFVRQAWHVVEPAQEFVEGWVLSAIAMHLESVESGEINRLLVNVPPGFSKSLMTSVFFPAWVWGPRGKPAERFLCTAHNQNLALRDSLKMRRLITSEWYQTRWGDRVKLTGDQSAKSKYENTNTGFREAVAFESMTGSRGSVVILDDPHSVDSALSDVQRESTVQTFLESLPTRLNNPATSAIIVIMQRLHQEDVSGIILEKNLGYTHLCYDDQTEILTRNGWIKFPDLAEGSEVLGVNPDTLEARWEIPTAYTRLPYAGDMIHYKTMTADLMVTPDHRMVYCDVNDMRKGEAKRWRVRRAGDLPTEFHLPQIVNWHGSEEKVLFAGKTWEPKSFAEFMGWYLAEGCASSDRCSTRIVQNRDGLHAPDIDRVLSNIPFEWKRIRHGEKTDCWYIGSKPLAVALEELGKSLNKRAPDVLKSLAPEHLQAFLIAYAKGDGHFAVRNSLKITIGTGSKIMADDLQECAVKAGWAASLSIREQKANGRTLNGYSLPDSTIYRLYIRARKGDGGERKISSKIRAVSTSKVLYDGIVYCVSVPSTAIVVRRNGRVSVSGNCLPMEFDPTRRCVTEIGFEDPRQEEGELLFPERFPQFVVERDKQILGPYGYAGQFQQSPAPRGGGIWKREWFQLWDDETAQAQGVVDASKYPPMDYVIASLDPAYSSKEENDPSGLVILGVFQRGGSTARRLLSRDGTITEVLDDRDTLPAVMIMYAWEKRLDIHGPELVRENGESEFEFKTRQKRSWGLVEHVIDACNRYGVDKLLIESKASGLSVAQEIKRLNKTANWDVQLINPGNADKISRAYAVQPIFSGGYVFAPDKDWADKLIAQCEAFPKAKHDDMLDALSQGLKFLRERQLLARTDEIAADIRNIAAYRPQTGALYDV